jgi:hypothetical protein
VTLRNHSLELRPWNQWRFSRSTTFAVTTADGVLAVAGLRPITMRLMCKVAVEPALTDSGLHLRIGLCAGGPGDPCNAGPFPADYVRLLPQNGDEYLDDGRIGADGLLTYENVSGPDPAEPVVPVGRYQIIATKSSCDAQTVDHVFDAERCAPASIGLMRCRS